MKITILLMALSLTSVNAFTATTSKKAMKPVFTEQKEVVSSNTHTQESAAASSLRDFFTGGHTFLNEVALNLSNGSFTSEKPCSACDSNTNFNLYLSYLHHLQDNIQLGTEVGFQSAYSTTMFDLIAVGVYNMDSDFKNSIFGKVGLGLTSVSAGTSGSGSETKFGFFAGAGKRFALFNNITYSPEARIIKKGDLDISFQVTFVNFSIYWN